MQRGKQEGSNRVPRPQHITVFVSRFDLVTGSRGPLWSFGVCFAFNWFGRIEETCDRSWSGHVEDGLGIGSAILKSLFEVCLATLKLC